MGETLHQLLSELSPLHREALELRYLQNLGVDQVAVHLGVPRETARSRIKRGLADLRERIAQRYGSREAWLLACLPWLEATGGAPSMLAPDTAHNRVLQSKSGSGFPWGLAASALGVSVALVILYGLTTRGQHSANPESPELVADSEQGDSNLITDGPHVRQVEAPVFDPPEDRTRRARIVVTDVHGNPQAAEIWASYDYNQYELIGETDAQGIHAIELTDRWIGVLGEEAISEHVCIYARAQGTVRSPMHFVRCPRGEWTTIELRTGPEAALLTGLVVDETGAPVQGAMVSLGSPVPKALELDADHLVYDLPDGDWSRPDGYYEFDETDPGRRPVTVEMEGYVPLRTWIDLGPGDSKQLDLVVRRGVTVVGRVVNEHGLGVVGARVWTQLPNETLGTNGLVLRETLTGEAGTYTLMGLSPGSLRLFAQDPSTPTRWATSELFAGTQGEQEWSPELGAKPGVRVQVQDAQGTPHVGATVSLVQTHPKIWFQSVTSDDQGIAEFHAIPEGPFSMSVSLASLSSSWPDAIREGLVASEDPVSIEIDPNQAVGRLAGFLVDAQGTPLTKGRLVVTHAPGVDCFFELGSEGRFEALGQVGHAWFTYVHPSWGVAFLGAHELAPYGTQAGQWETPLRAQLKLDWIGAKGHRLHLHQTRAAGGDPVSHHLYDFAGHCRESLDLFPGEYQFEVHDQDMNPVESGEFELEPGAARTVVVETI